MSWSCAECGTRRGATPRFATAPTSGSKTWQQDVLRTAHLLGTPPLPWQRLGIRLLTERRADGLPRYRLVAVSVPRQQGKSVLSRAAITARSQHEPGMEIYGTAQSRDAAARHVMRLGDALLLSESRVSDETLRYLPEKVLRGRGQESVSWPNGTIYRPLAPTESGGHGDSIDLLVLDEAWTVTAQVLGGVAPAMIARPLAQTLAISTMGTIESTAWNGMVVQGRAAVHEENPTTAYVEYSAPDDEAVWDESQWHDWMPALGRTVSHEAIREAIKLMMADPDQGPNEVVRAFGNRTVKAKIQIFPTDWVERAWRVMVPPKKFVVAVDVNEDPVGASVGQGFLTEDGMVASRLIEARPGTPTWVPGYVKALIEKRSVAAVVASFGGPSRVVKAELEALCERAGVPLENRSLQDLAADCSGFYDGLREGRILMSKAEPLEEAIGGARRVKHGELWYVSRGLMAVDASPLITTILACAMASELALTPVVPWQVW